MWNVILIQLAGKFEVLNSMGSLTPKRGKKNDDRMFGNLFQFVRVASLLPPPTTTNNRGSMSFA